MSGVTPDRPCGDWSAPPSEKGFDGASAPAPAPAATLAPVGAPAATGVQTRGERRVSVFVLCVLEPGVTPSAARKHRRRGDDIIGITSGLFCMCLRWMVEVVRAMRAFGSRDRLFLLGGYIARNRVQVACDVDIRIRAYMPAPPADPTPRSVRRRRARIHRLLTRALLVFPHVHTPALPLGRRRL
jgi:hypothetical protein